MATPEGKVKDRVVTILKRLKIYYFFPSMNGYGRAGVPDIICCVNGSFMGIECKAGDNQPTDLQEIEMSKIRLSGGYTFVVRESNIVGLEALLLLLLG